MRRHGSVDSVAGLGLSDHLCWVYDGPDAFLGPGLEWLSDGLRLNQRLFYSADRPPEQLREDVQLLSGVDRLIDAGVLELVELGKTYPGCRVLDPDAQLAAYDAMAQQAVTEGYAGIRVLAEGTPLVARAAGHAECASWEHVAERYMGRGNPLAAFCAYHRSTIGEEAAQELLASHALFHDDRVPVPFQVFGDGNEVKLIGEVDAFSAPMFQRILARVGEPEPVVLDLSEAEFVDHHALLAIARSSARLDLRGASPTLRRLWDMMDLSVTPGVRFV